LTLLSEVTVGFLHNNQLGTIPATTGHLPSPEESLKDDVQDAADKSSEHGTWNARQVENRDRLFMSNPIL
jgi:hypothetical protein